MAKRTRRAYASAVRAVDAKTGGTPNATNIGNGDNFTKVAATQAFGTVGRKESSHQASAHYGGHRYCSRARCRGSTRHGASPTHAVAGGRHTGPLQKRGCGPTSEGTGTGYGVRLSLAGLGLSYALSLADGTATALAGIYAPRRAGASSRATSHGWGWASNTGLSHVGCRAAGPPLRSRIARLSSSWAGLYAEGIRVGRAGLSSTGS